MIKHIYTIIYKYKTQIMYLICGLATTIVNVITYYSLYSFIQIDNIISTMVAWLISVVFAYITNKLIVFNNRNFQSFLKEGAQFFLSRIATGIFDVAIMYIGVNLLNFYGTAVKIIANVVVVVLNYIVCKLIFDSNKSKGNG